MSVWAIWCFLAKSGTMYHTMAAFHEHKLWQAAYVALMDLHETFDGKAQDDSDTVEELFKSATDVTAKIADGLSRLDKRFGRQILMDAIGMVAVVRTHLAVAWGQGLLDDDAFRQLDTKYDELAVALQQVR